MLSRNNKTLIIHKLKHLFLIFFLIFFLSLFFISSNLINKKNDNNVANFEESSRNIKFENLKNFFVSKINSPYEEVSYDKKQ